MDVRPSLRLTNSWRSSWASPASMLACDTTNQSLVCEFSRQRPESRRHANRSLTTRHFACSKRRRPVAKGEQVPGLFSTWASLHSRRPRCLTAIRSAPGDDTPASIHCRRRRCCPLSASHEEEGTLPTYMHAHITTVQLQQGCLQARLVRGAPYTRRQAAVVTHTC
jgi:hypothetical protein